MPSSDSNHTTESRYVRLNKWNNRLYMLLLIWFAVGISRVGMLSRGKNRERFEGTSRFLHNLALYIGRPETAHMMADPQLLKSAMAETLWLTAFITLVVVWTLMSVYGFLLIPLFPVVLLVIVLSLLFTHLLYLLVLSGDVYQQVQDESQRQCAYQASASALRFAGFFLIVLSLCLAFAPAWRTWVAIDLSVLVLATRMVYLARLAQLRWAVLALVHLEDEGEALVEGN